MKLKAIKDAVGGYRVAGTEVIFARESLCRCCWYVFDIDEVEVVESGLNYAGAKQAAFKYVTELQATNA